MPGAAVLVLLIVSLQSVYCSPLDDYINKPDSTYKFEDLGNPDKEDGYTTYYINMTSQTWLSSKDLDRSIWWHYITINIPDVIKVTDTAFIYITGGYNSDTRPAKGSTDMLFTSLLSLTSGSVTATLFQIPNEPIVFTEDKLQKRRTEDAIIAFTWYYFAEVLNGKNPEWLLRLPMTKAVVRAMDTVTTFSANNNPAFKITKFVIGGASKRGWTTWTTGVVDKRVIGIVPIVMDLLNMVKNLHHHYRSLGGWTFAFNDYTDLNITGHLDDPTTQDIANVVDPYSYVDRLTMPKLIITTSGDEFFLPDNSYYYWDKLQGEKHIRTIPNAEHSCAGHVTSLMLTARSFYLSLVLNVPRPKMTWTLNQTAHGGSIILRTNVKPNEVKMYHATTLDNKRRDFRLIALDPDGKAGLHPVLWSEKSLQAEPTGEYVATMNTPNSGWTAFFIQAAFKGPQESVLELTTQVNIIPNTFPFPDCHGIECQGKLV